MRGGRRPGAGRKPGQWNKRTVEEARRVGPLGERALNVLGTAMEDPKVPWSCRITAANAIADRAFGRAPQSVSLEVTKRLNDLSLAELAQLEAKLAGEQQLIDITPGAATDIASASDPTTSRP